VPILMEAEGHVTRRIQFRGRHPVRSVNRDGRNSSRGLGQGRRPASVSEGAPRGDRRVAEAPRVEHRLKPHSCSEEWLGVHT
jgi:hypothetical protein